MTGWHGSESANFMDDEHQAQIHIAEAGKPTWDERRGVHLLSPGDMVRYRGDLWDVTGVHLATEKRFSTITLLDPADRFKTELRVPLSIVETACEVYLRAEPK